MDLKFQLSTDITLNHILERIEHLTFPPIRKKIQTIPLQEPFTGVWALDGKEIIGVILADKKDNGISELFSFYVKPEKRNYKIGSQLLSLLETSLQNQGVSYVQSRYRSDWNSIVTIEKLLDKNKWETPILVRIIAEGNIKAYNKISWPNVKFPSEFSFVPYDQISTDEQKQINELVKNNSIPKEFNPFQHADKIFIPASIMLKYKSKIVGWDIAYRLKEDTIEYNNLFLLNDYRRHGYAIGLLQQSFSRQYDQKVPKVTWIVNADNEPVMKIVEKIARKYLSKYIEVRASRKVLN
jgi:GNAT superfamily N-acetyltransferase